LGEVSLHDAAELILNLDTTRLENLKKLAVWGDSKYVSQKTGLNTAQSQLLPRLLSLVMEMDMAIHETVFYHACDEEMA